MNVSSRFRLSFARANASATQALTSISLSRGTTPLRDFRDAKAMAQTLRDALAARSVTLTHSESLELIAHILGLRDWNVLSARIQAETRLPAAAPAISMPSGTLPLVPMRDTVFFPNVVGPIFIGRHKTKRALERAMVHNRRILVVTQRRSTDETPTGDALFNVGVIAEIVDLAVLGDGPIRAIVKALERATIVKLDDGEFISAQIAVPQQTGAEDAEAHRLMQAVKQRLGAYFNIDFDSAPAPYLGLPLAREPGSFADAIAPLLAIPIGERQDLLETIDVVTRLEKIEAIVAADRPVAKTA